MTLQEFIEKYTGKRVGTNDANFGECVGLVQKYIQELGLTFFYGHAKDLFMNAPSSEYTKIKNTPTGVPPTGSILCWDSSFGGGYGHTGIVKEATVDSFVSFDQNWVKGQAPVLVTHPNYVGVIGWLIPKVLVITPTTDQRPYFFDLMNAVTFMRPREEVTKDMVELFVKEYPTQLLRSGLWDKLRKKAGIEGDTNNITVEQLFSTIQDPLQDIITSQGRTIDTKSQELQEKTQKLLELKNEFKQTQDSLARTQEIVEQKEQLRQKWHTEFVAVSKWCEELKTELTNSKIACKQKLNAIKTIQDLSFLDIMSEVVSRLKRGAGKELHI